MKLSVWYMPGKAVSVRIPLFTEMKHWTIEVWLGVMCMRDGIVYRTWDRRGGVDIFLKLYISDCSMSLEKLDIEVF